MGFVGSERSGCGVFVVDTVGKSVVGTEVKQLSAIENGFITAFEEAITLEREGEMKKKIRVCGEGRGKEVRLWVSAGFEYQIWSQIIQFFRLRYIIFPKTIGII